MKIKDKDEEEIREILASLNTKSETVRINKDLARKIMILSTIVSNKFALARQTDVLEITVDSYLKSLEKSNPQLFNLVEKEVARHLEEGTKSTSVIDQPRESKIF